MQREAKGGRRRDPRAASRRGSGDSRERTEESFLATARRGFQEFLTVPTLILVGFLLLGLVTLALDRLRPTPLEPLRQLLTSHLFRDSQATARLLGAVATTLVTVTSITFSVLLIALQQSASTMSTQVFDQFLRRRSNQLAFGFFLGLGLYALFTLSTVTPSFDPAIGAFVALVLAGLALALIPVVIYTTIDQMRPAEIVSAIRAHALSSRETQRPLVARTRRRPTRSGPAVEVRSTRTGFVTGLDLDTLGRRTREAGRDAELQLEVSIGTFVGFDDLIASLRGADEPPEDTSDVEAAVRIGQQRDIGQDPDFALEQLEAIAWTSVSSSKQNPEPGMLVVRYVRDLIARWLAEPPPTEDERREPLPVVYQDDLLPAAIGILGSLAIAASEGMQHQTAATVYLAFASIFPRLPDDLKGVAESSIMRGLSGLADHILSRELERSLRSLEAVLRAEHAEPVAEAVGVATDRMVRSAGRLSSRGSRQQAG